MKTIWKNKINKIELSDKGKKIFSVLGGILVDDYDEAIRLYKWMEDKEDTKSQYICGKIKIEKKSGSYVVENLEGDDVELTKESMKDIMSQLLTLVEPVLPLGSVVNIKKECFEEVKSISRAKKIQIIITHRFITKKDSKFFFLYAGTVYPFGFIKDNNLIYFGNQMVEKIEHRGYSDETDRGYVRLMKESFALNRDIISSEYADKEQIEKFFIEE